MRAVGARPEARAASLVASTCLFVLCDSPSAFAACAIDTPTQLLALTEQSCSVLGKSYDGGVENIAVQADGPGASITWTSVGLSKILTSGDFLPAVQAGEGGSITITGGAIQTSGGGAPAVLSTSGGSSVIDLIEGGSSVRLSSVEGGSSVILSGGTTVQTHGDGSAGLAVSGAGASLTATGADPSTGVVVKTVGLGSIGATNGVGPEFESGGTMNLTNTTIVTEGQDSHAVAVGGPGSVTNLGVGNALTTEGNGAIGIYATGGGVVNGTGGIVTVSTAGTNSEATGLSAYGVNADGAGSQINLAGATITTAGDGAVGLYASDAMATGHGGDIIVSGPLSVTTGTAPFSYGAWAQGAGSTIALNGSSAFTINGGAFALYATQGGAISTAGALNVVVNGDTAGGVEVNDSGSVATLAGATTIALNGSSDGGLFAAAGGAISAQGPTTITVAGPRSVGVEARSGSVTASGALNVTTSQASSTAFVLGGTSPSILATGGGIVSAAGNAIVFDSAVGAVATFDNFNITSLAGDLIFADPSIATVNFNHTVANAGTGNLLNATLGSTVAFNANASTLTGAIQTDAASVTNVSLANGSNWTMSASSAATSLNLANSAIVFSPSGGFKTLTVGSYFGTGANIGLNTALGGPSAGSTDQLIINGGSAAGLTALTIKNTSGTGSPTTGAGIPVVVVTKGGSTAPGAFYLADHAPIVAGGLEYTLGRGSNQDWYLTSSAAPTVSDIQNSVTSLAQAQLNQLITSRLLGSLLLGANEQVSGCDCGGGFASIGSFSLGSHGRWSLNDSVTLLAGAAFEQYYQDGANVRAAPIVAASLRYDPPNWGKSRPFFEVGAALSPYIDATYTRYYTNGLIPAQGVGSAVDRSVSVFGRVGWVDRVTPIDEVAVFGDLIRGWQQSGGYTEAASAVNPFPATVSTGVDRQDVVRFGATYTRLLFGNLEANVNAAIAYGFDNEFGSQVNVVSFGSVAPFPLLNSAWTEFGGRLGYRFSKNLAVDAFLIGTLGGEIGPTLHGGLGVRYAF